MALGSRPFSAGVTVTNPRKFPRARHGFSLIELLIVIAIIALLVSIISPTIKRARWLTVTTVCAAHLKDFSLAVTAYANDADSYLPRHDVASTGRNMWDVSYDFYDVLHETYHLPHRMFFCPALSDEHIEPQGHGNHGWFDHYAHFARIGYNYWVPRKFGGTMSPPDYGDFQFEDVLVRGPISNLRDPQACENPILVDFCGSFHDPDTDLRDFDPSTCGDLMHAYNNHLWQGLLDRVNEAWLDGHVETISATNVEAYFFSQNRWIWR